MKGETLITVENVSRYFADYCAVSDVCFTVQRGEVLGFLGPNGAGKTTTMQIISGVLAASSGTVSIANFDIVEQAKQAKKHIGFLPEQPPLYIDQTVDEYLYYCGQLRLLPADKLKRAIASCKERCGLEEVGKRLIANLSKGYQQRVGIAQAIIHNPSVVILDEPTVGLDPNQIVEIRELISELGSDHSVILSTHILPEVQAICNRVLIINEGKLVMDEAIQTLQQDKTYLAFVVALRNPPVPEELENIAGVVDISTIDLHRFRINYSIDDNPAERLSKHAAESGWGLFELIPEKDNLEQTFVRLTSSDVN